MENIADRIIKLIEALGISKNKFAENIGISSSLISQITTKKNSFRVDILQKITSNYPKVDTDWLLNGVGEMWNIDNKEIITKSNEDKIIDKSFVSNEAPLYLEIHAQNRISKELMNGTDELSKIYQNINTFTAFQYIIKNFDHYYFERVERKKYEIGKYYNGQIFDFEQYRIDVLKELESLKDFAAPLEAISSAINTFYSQAKDADKMSIIFGFFQVLNG